MTICPIAIAVGCVKCPVFKICPVKSSLGDYVPPKAAPSEATPSKAKPKPARAATARKTASKAKPKK